MQQGAAGDAYHMYPFFSGLCGYVFGKNRAGNLDPSDIGVANPKFLKNASLIDKWNKAGLINSKVDYGARKDAFLKGKAAYWITGPWKVDTLKTSGLKLPDRPGAARSSCALACRSSASRASWSRSTRPRTASRAPRRTWSATT